MSIKFRINFDREKEIKKKEFRRKLKQVFIPGIVIILELFVAIFAPYRIYVKHFDALMEKKTRDERQLKRLTNELSTIQSKRKDIKGLVNFMRWFNRNTMAWASKLAVLGNVMPDGIWLTDLSIKSEKEITNASLKKNSSPGSEKLLQIKGMVHIEKGENSNKPLKKITELIKGINNNNKFSNDFFPVNLIYIRRPHEKYGFDVVEFELRGKLRKG